jgi:hypothetical protein
MFAPIRDPLKIGGLPPTLRASSLASSEPSLTQASPDGNGSQCSRRDFHVLGRGRLDGAAG